MLLTPGHVDLASGTRGDVVQACSSQGGRGVTGGEVVMEMTVLLMLVERQQAVPSAYVHQLVYRPVTKITEHTHRTVVF